MIIVRHDHKLSFPDIEMPIYSEDADNASAYKQTNVIGILTPIFRLNNITIPWEIVSYMQLNCNPVPSLFLTMIDNFGLIKSLNTPGHDNVLYLQILPPFENAYKKIELSFYISNCSISGDVVSLVCSYYIPKWYDHVMKPYGKISSYELFEKVSNEYSLGFCTNIDGTKDSRYIYNPNMTPTELLSSEIEYSGEGDHVFSWWVDFWNNINFIDLNKEYNEVLSDKDMMIWVSGNLPGGSNPDYVPQPNRRPAVLCNLPVLAGDPLYIDEYWPKTTSNVTDKIFEIYIMKDHSQKSTFIQDGDVYNDIFVKYEYGGELIGSYDYLSQKACRDMYLSKINSQTIQVSLNMPVLGLMKGGHVNLWWYDINNPVTDDIDNSDIKSNIPLPDNIDLGDSRSMINKTVSGQYYIMDVQYTYSSFRWSCLYTLGRPAQSVERLNEVSESSFVK